MPEPKSIDPDSEQAAEVKAQFDEQVNMTAKALERWLATDESKSVGQKNGGGESTGHHSGRRIVEILGTKKAELTGEDYAHMKYVNGYIARHLKQRPDKPKSQLAETDWAYSLKNWGHDPVR